jgi:hypothetical protein
MRSSSAFRYALLLALLGSTGILGAQQTTGGTITGSVRDSAQRPVAGADVVAQPGAHRTRTDSAGHFVFYELGPDRYTVRARKLGFAPEEWDVKLSKGGKVDVQLVLKNTMVSLDTITIRADRECSRWSLDGFVCRKRGGKGVFLDYTDIDEKEPVWTADIFFGMKGFRTDVQRTPYGPQRVVAHHLRWGCVSMLVDGRPAGGARRVPDNPYELVAVEAYASPDSVPKEYQEYTWPASGNLVRSGRCSVIVFWTRFARVTPR